MPRSLLVKQVTATFDAVKDRPKPHKDLPIKDVSILRAELQKVQRDYFDKDREHKLTLEELRQANNSLKTTKKGYDAMFSCLKNEKEAAEKSACDARKKLKTSLETVDSLKADISKRDAQRGDDLCKMEEMETELGGWKQSYTSAIKASKADANEKFRDITDERDKLFSEVNELRKNLEEANVRIDQLGKKIEQKEKVNEETMTELRETKVKLEEKTEELERVQNALFTCQEEVTVAMQVCQRDAAVAEQTLVATQGRRADAEAKIEILQKQMQVLHQLVSCLEEDNHNLDQKDERCQSEINAMRAELTKSREEFQKALNSSMFDLMEAEAAHRSCLHEKGCALADSELARKQLRKIEEHVCFLQNQMDLERKRNQKPWWKKLLSLLRKS